MTPIDGSATVAARPGRGERIARWLLVPLIVVLVTAVFVFFVFFQTVQVSGTSMLPGLRNGDYLFITRGYANPVRGDVIVFQEQDQGHTIDVVKRVIGTPGDVVAVTDDAATVDGQPEPARDLVRGYPNEYPGDTGVFPAETVPAGSVYVLGDNRPVSLDSRFRGPIALSEVKGRAVFRFAPITRLGPVR